MANNDVSSAVADTTATQMQETALEQAAKPAKTTKKSTSFTDLEHEDGVRDPEVGWGDVEKKETLESVGLASHGPFTWGKMARFMGETYGMALLMAIPSIITIWWVSAVYRNIAWLAVKDGSVHTWADISTDTSLSNNSLMFYLASLPTILQTSAFIMVPVSALAIPYGWAAAKPGVLRWALPYFIWNVIYMSVRAMVPAIIGMRFSSLIAFFGVMFTGWKLGSWAKKNKLAPKPHLLKTAIGMPPIIFMIVAFLYVFFIPARFGASGTAGRLVIRLLLHPIIFEFLLMGCRFYGRRYSGTHASYAAGIVLAYQAIASLYGRFLLASIEDVTLMLIVNVLLAVEEIGLRLTVRHRDQFLYRCHPKLDPKDLEQVHSQRLHADNLCNEQIFEVWAAIIAVMYVGFQGSSMTVGGHPAPAIDLFVNFILQIVTEAISDVISVYWEVTRHEIYILEAWKTRFNNNWKRHFRWSFGLSILMCLSFLSVINSIFCVRKEGLEVVFSLCA